MKKLDNLSAISNNYDAIFCDVWGVVHNGAKAFFDSVEALKTAKEAGTNVIMITNAPSDNIYVKNHLKNVIGIDADFYDEIVTSGDVAASIIESWKDKKCYHIGLHSNESDQVLPDYEHMTDLENAEYVLSTFLAKVDEIELSDYDFILNKMKEKSLPFLCSNPDKIVDVGGTLYYCAGALAEKYEALGGEVVYTGKPNINIYETAKSVLADMGKRIDLKKVLVIGDSLSTDVPGANLIGADMLLVGDGIHAREYEAEAGKEALKSDAYQSHLEDLANEMGVTVEHYMLHLS